MSSTSLPLVPFFSSAEEEGKELEDVRDDAGAAQTTAIEEEAETMADKVTVAAAAGNTEGAGEEDSDVAEEEAA